jgi:hypothetical protein
MSRGELAKLSVHVLKEVLHKNHVLPGPVLEKEELVDKVVRMVEEERRERERAEVLRRQEEEAMRRAREEAERAREEREREKVEREAARRAQEAAAEQPIEEAASVSNSAEPAPASPAATDAPGGPRPLSPKAKEMAATLERTGLCVVCQDEEANIAIVDCG